MPNEDQFETDKFNIMIVNSSNNIYSEVSLVLTGFCVGYTRINIDSNDIKPFSRELFNYEYTREVVPMGTNDIESWRDENDEFIDMTLFITPNVGSIRIYRYKLYPLDETNFSPIIIHDKNNPKYKGIKPPNIKIIIQNNDVYVLSYY